MSRARSAVARAKSQSTGDNSPIADALDALEVASDGGMLVLSSVTQVGPLATSALVGAPAVLIAPASYSLLAGDQLIVQAVHGLQLEATGLAGGIGIRVIVGSPVLLPVQPDFQSAFVPLGLTGSSPGAATWTFTAPVAGSYSVGIDWYVDDVANIATNNGMHPITLQISKVLG